MKTRLIIFFLLLTIGGSLIINACKKTDVHVFGKPHDLSFTNPDGFPQQVYNFEGNPLTEEGFILGKKLFHDHILSKNLDVTCSSCHQQHAGYTTFDHDLGHGTNHQHTSRNVPVIFNMVWQKEFQWDGSVARLIDQPLTCLTAPEKMGEEVNSVISKLDTSATYKQLFGEAFGDEGITGDRIARALTQFVASLVSAGSKYDLVKKGQQTFNASEQSGYALFQQKCNSCHTEPLFTDLSYRNVGLDLDPFHHDFGRMKVTNDPADSLKFKVPSLRNVQLTAYYTHDGRFEAISEMLDHYAGGVVTGPTTDPLVKDQIPLSNLEKFYLEEFLNTLTDSVFVNDPRFDAP
jgi:cytochrome c peroxidase